MRWNTPTRLTLTGALLLVSIVASPRAQNVVNDTDGATPLLQAVRTNDLKTVDALIKRGADVKATTRYGVTPIGLAALNGNAAILRRVLDHGAAASTAKPSGKST